MDTGSPQVQLKNFETRMQNIVRHIKLHPKDDSARWGLINTMQKYVMIKNLILRQQ